MDTFPRISRRNFLRTSALATAGLVSLPRPAFAAEPTRKLGFALCGLGNLSTNQLAPALQETKYCRLAGIITGTPAKATAWKSKYNLPDHSIYSYDTMSKLADNPDIDVVYVVTPNALHAESTIKAAKAGKHVLCEKPMEVSVAQCQAMIDACKAAGRQLAIGYRVQFEPNNIECARLVREKVFGKIHLIQAGFGFAIGDPTQWRLNHALAGGGPLMDVGIYALQTSRVLSGLEPISVSGTTTVEDHVKFNSVEESISWHATFPGGLLAKCEATYRINGVNRHRTFAENGWFGLEPAYGYNGLHGMRSDGQEIKLPSINQFATEMDDFAQCILNNQPTRVPGEEGLRDVKIMMAIYESARTGKPVDLT